MSKKIIIANKLFLSMFVGSIFLGLGLVFGQVTYQSVEDPAQCSNIVGYSVNGWSSDSTNGTTYATNPASPYSWYINNESAIGLAASNTSNLTVCNDFSLESPQTRKQWKQDLCNSTPQVLKNYQTSLLSDYVNNYAITTFKSEVNGWGFSSSGSVWKLQYLMNDLSCHNHKDCKLGVITISDFLFCNVCQSINSERVEPNSTDANNCPTGYVPVDNISCCQKAQDECFVPTINIDGVAGNTSYENNDSIVVDIDYSDNTVGSLQFLTNLIQVEGATISVGPTEDINNKKVSLTITPDQTKNTIKITIPETMATLGTLQCPAAESTLFRTNSCIEPLVSNTSFSSGCCMPKNEWQSCDNRDEFGLEANSTGFDILNGKKCYIENTIGTASIPREFCPCNKPSDDGCTQYGDGYFDDGYGCCITCGDDQIQSGTGCVCDPNKKCSKDGYAVDPDTCKCKCDPTQTCCGIELNTVVPFIGDCIEMTTQNDTTDYNDPNTSRVNQLNAFPFLMMGLSKILVTVILIFSFLIVIASGLMMVTGVADEGNYKKGMERIKKVVVALILLGSSGLILKLINPNFFGG